MCRQKMEGLEKVLRFQGGVISCQAAKSISGVTLLGVGAGQRPPEMLTRSVPLNFP